MTVTPVTGTKKGQPTVNKVAVNEDRVHEKVQTKNLVLKGQDNTPDLSMTNTVSEDGAPSLTLGATNAASPAGAPAPVRIQNVAPGVKPNDAATVGQLQGLRTEMQSNNNVMRREYRGGIAATMAAASLPQSYRPGMSGVALAGATYRGANALAVGMSSVSENGRMVFKLNAAVAPGNNSSVGAGVGYFW